VLNDWVFKNENFIDLPRKVKLADARAFDFEPCFDYDIIMYLRYALLGVKRYLLGDKEENLPRNRVMYQRLKLLDRALKLLMYAVAFYFVFIKYDFVNVLKSYFN
jgi:hypothetical protein